MGERDGWREETRPDDEDLTDEEVRAAIEGLTDLDRQKLIVIERRYRAGTDFAESDLLQEAICSAFERQRRCPRDVSFVRTVSMMMRSIGGHRRNALARHDGFDAPIIAGKDGAIRTPADTLAAAGLDPEAAVMERERPDVVAAALSISSDDEDVQYVIMGIADGLKGGTELQAATGLSSNRVHYALRKIRKRLGSDPEGWLT